MGQNTLPGEDRLPVGGGDFEQGSLAAGQCSSTRGLGWLPARLWQKTHCEKREEEFKAESKSSCQGLSAKMWEVLRRKPRILRAKDKWAGGNDSHWK